MRINEVITTDEDVDPRFVNSEIKKTAWQEVGQGATASVWQHMDEPTTVVKVVGGGEEEMTEETRNTAIAFVHFCVDHGHESSHFPIIHGINVDDEDVVQIRIERLSSLPGGTVGSMLADLADAVEYHGITNRIIPYITRLDKCLQQHENLKLNSAQDIAYAIAILL